MNTQTQQAANKTIHSCKLAAVVCAGVLGLAGAEPAAAGAIADIRNKVTDIFVRVRTTIPKKVDAVHRDLQTVIERLPNPVDELGSGIGDRQTLSAIIESVQPVAQLVTERVDEYQSFNAEGFRYDLSASVDNIVGIQVAVTGQVGPALSKLQEKVYDAQPFVLFALSQTPLVSLLEATAGMTDELQTLGRISGAAIDYVEMTLPAGRVAQLASLNMSIAAPDFVPCGFVLENVSKDDIDKIKLSRLRANQISNVAGLALQVLPKSQTVGINVVGGATVSLPNPLTPMAATIKKAADDFYRVTAKWTDKYEKCERNTQVYDRLTTFLNNQGY